MCLLRSSSNNLPSGGCADHFATWSAPKGPRNTSIELCNGHSWLARLSNGQDTQNYLHNTYMIHVFGRTLSRTPKAASNAFPTGVRRTALWRASTMTGGTRLLSSARSSGFCATCATTRAAKEFSTNEYALVGARSAPFTRYRNSRRAAASTPHARVACATCRKSFGMPYECTCALRGERPAPQRHRGDDASMACGRREIYAQGIPR